MKPFILVGAIMLSALPAAAQTDKQQPPSPCQAEPGQNSSNGNDNAQTDGAQTGGAQTGEQKPPPGDLTQKLDPCDGVLKPPPTGDAGMTAPPPDAGNTPIIKPGQVPQQPPAQ